MVKNKISKKQFVLAFGRDEFDHSMFALDRLAFKVIYIGPRSRTDEGNTWVSYEFRQQDNALHYVDGSPVSKPLLISLNGSPDKMGLDGLGARVGVEDESTGRFLGVGRASLWTEKGYINWKATQ